MNAAYRSSLGFPGSSENFSVVEDDIIEQCAPSDLRNPKSRNNRGLSVLQRFQPLRRVYGLSVPNDNQAVQVLLMDALAAFGSSRDGAEALVEQKQCELNEVYAEATVEASESKLSGTKRQVQQLELTTDTVHQLVGKVYEAEKAFGGSQEHVQYLEEILAEQSNQVIAKDAEAANERERLSKLGSSDRVVG